MISSRAATHFRTFAKRPFTIQQRCFREASQSRVAVANRPPRRAKGTALLLSLTIGAGCLYYVAVPRNIYAEEVPSPAEIKFETRRKKTSSREENRDQISSQHLQVKKSWENPGVYSWGANSGERECKNLRTISYTSRRTSRSARFRRSIY